MTHHALVARRLRIAAAALAAPLLAASLISCSSSGGDGGSQDELITGALRIVVSGSAPVRGVQLDMHHGAQIVVLDVTPGTPFGAGTCAENLEAGRVRLGCVSGADIATPFTAWTLAIQHSSAVNPLDAVTDVSCTASGPTGSAVAVTCTVE